MMPRVRLQSALFAVLSLMSPVALAAQAAPRPVTVDDFLDLKRVSDPRISPDGRWVAYVLTTMSLKDDKSESRIWMAPVGGGDPIPLTATGTSASSPRWSPDGKWLGFLSARDTSATQVWTLNRLGGEAEQLTDVKQGVSGFEWAPDSHQLALLIKDPTPEQAGDSSWAGLKAKTPRPWVIDRLQFKRDYAGYLDRRRTHLFRFDIEGKKLTQLTSGDWDDGDPAWSPDGRLIAFASNRDSVDGSYNSDLWVVAADDTTRGGTTRRLTDNAGSDAAPAWSPDGRWIAYVRKTSAEPIGMIYDPGHLAVLPAGGGTPRDLTDGLDRDVSNPAFAPDGQSIYLILEDGGSQHLLRVPVAGGVPEHVIGGDRVVSQFDLAPDGQVVSLVSEPLLPAEVFSGLGPALKQVTVSNAAWLARVRLSPPEKIRFRSRDGTAVEAFLFRPIGYQSGQRVPTLLRIHGGPVSQFDWSFSFDAQLFAAHGYAVVMANPRGSSGYGKMFARAIFADWGTRDFEDVMAAVDQAISMGVADPAHLGVGGWSYGGILTNYVITKSTRFKGAVSGASEALYTSNYGHDHYQYLWEIELGLPWRNQKAWDRISPFWSVEKITTPTLWMGGEADWNVPILNSEQMFQAMKRLGRTTQLVVYPGQHHGLAKPSYLRDRYQRYLAWYDKYVK
jgi:dipeptidyl aminopeptidase/acylaminoacyl peptidase